MAENVQIGGRNFVCVPLAQANFKDVAGIYVILCVNSDRSWAVLDVGESGQLGTRINTHDRSECWQKNCATNNIWVCVFPTPSEQYTDDERRAIESELRQLYKPPCGER